MPEQTRETTRLLRRGSRGDDVKRLQQSLASAGFDPGPIDGIFGALTEAAVRGFQTAHGLVVDGIVGPRTREALAAAGPGPSPGPGPGPSPGPGPGPTPATGVDWSTVDGDTRMRYVMDRLVGHYGYPVNGAAGVVGNLWAESGVIPQRIEGSRASTPMRAKDFDGTVVDFTAEQVMNRNRIARTGPALPGVGLAQWTTPGRRAGLFEHEYNGARLGADVMFDMDASVDYLDHELRTSYRRVHGVISRPDVSVDDACDEVVYNFEVPGSILDNGTKLPRTDPRVQEVFRGRRTHAARALRVHEAQPR
ncbi:phage tail tip lysozyme [Phytoactinopolyspora limicola]|uniref:phage tail tip lysozyme n=1 Tax=Phytoactinopolyspora limicola TaxID=2715536 RepID=UPI001407EAD7|nr:phage tail tip lysozyme [Phytoactinopolyspora limicola]